MIGILSDTHDNVENILKAIKIFENVNVDFIIHCGDVVAPATLRFFKGIHTKVVKGNCDGDIEHFKIVLEEIGGEYLGEIGELEISGKKILVYHGDDQNKLRGFIDKGEYDYIFTGHTHKGRDEKIGRTRVVNPGAHYYGAENTVVLFDLNRDKVKFINVKGAGIYADSG